MVDWYYLQLITAGVFVSGEEIPAAWRAPHVTAKGEYDSKWQDLIEIKSLEELNKIETDEWHHTLVAFLDDACARNFSPITLRNGQRYRPSRFLGIAVAKKADWSSVNDAWPGCAFGIIETKTGKVKKIEKYISSVPEREQRVQVQRLVQEAGRVDKYGFRNNLDTTKIQIVWFDTAEEEGIRKQPWRQVTQLDPHTEASLSSHVGHVFAALNAENEAFLAKFVCRGEHDWAIIDREALAHGADLPLNPVDHNAKSMQTYFHSKIESDSEKVKLAARELVFDLAFQKRMALSDVQSSLVPNVTADGFRLVPMPTKIFKEIDDWFQAQQKNTQNRNNILPESDGGPLYNQRYVPTLHTPLPADLKAQIWDELVHIMEAWAPNTAPLRGTSVYGVRTYERGSYLHLHDDTAGTHVVSGIINLDQRDCLADWPVHIFDHHGKLHELPMKPGDMLLYESAKLLHGRTIPCNCSMYANIFVHYAPADWDLAI